MVNRETFLEKLTSLRDTHLIKIVTGVRRCGKSVLLQQFVEHLIASGVEKNQIIMMNFDDLAFDSITDFSSLYTYVCNQLNDAKMNYIILDEVQKIDGFQKAVESLFLKSNVDIYLTGSSSKLLSGELATLLSGRYIEIKMLPLSFTEYISLRKEKRSKPFSNIVLPGSAVSDSQHSSTKFSNTPLSGFSLSNEDLFSDYVRFGAFPYTLELKKDEQNIRDYLESVYNTVLLKDVVARYKITDVPNLERITRFLLANIGNYCSAKKIADTLTSSGYKITSHTVDTYLDALHSSFIVYEAPRYDIKRKELFRNLSKEYAVDTGLRNSKTGFTLKDYGSLLENIVYLELLRREKNVYVGRSDSSEIDFVTISGDDIAYYQVTTSVLDKSVYNREYLPLKKIRNSYPKTVLTLDKVGSPIDDGIKQINIIDWLIAG